MPCQPSIGEGLPNAEVLRFRQVAERPPLRVGLLLDQYTVPSWVGEIINQLQAAPFVELSAVILNKHACSTTANERNRQSITAKLTRLVRGQTNLKKALYSVYEQWDSRTKVYDDPFVPVDLSEKLASLPTLSAEPIVKRYVHRFTDEELSTIHGWDLDVLVRFGFNILRGAILNAARYGIWSYHHGDHQHYRGGPAHFWELYDRNPVSGVILQVLTEELDAGR